MSKTQEALDTIEKCLKYECGYPEGMAALGTIKAALKATDVAPPSLRMDFIKFWGSRFEKNGLRQFDRVILNTTKKPPYGTVIFIDEHWVMVRWDDFGLGDFKWDTMDRWSAYDLSPLVYAPPALPEKDGE